MDGNDTNLLTRVPVGGQELPFWAGLVLAFSIVLIFGLVSFAVASRESWLGILAGLVATPNWFLYERYCHGRRDWDRTTHLELHDGRIAFVPSRKMQQRGYMKTDAPFPVGSGLEYRIERGDRYFTGDRGQLLGSSLWVVGPSGVKQRLLDNATGVLLKTAAVNLQRYGVPFRVLKAYDGQGGEHSEADITTRVETAPKVGTMGVLAVLIGTSNLWLGLLAGFFIHDVGRLIASGIAACAFISALTTYSKASKRTGLVEAVIRLPIYAAGYVFAVIIARYLFRT